MGKTLKELQEEVLKLQIHELENCKNPKPRAAKETDEPIIIAFYAEKGGVGKTTLCCALAHIFAQQDRVLIYDCDSQRSITSWLFGNEINLNFNGNVTNFINSGRFDISPGEHRPRTLSEQVLADGGDIRVAQVKTVRRNLFLVPGDRRLDILNEKISFSEGLTLHPQYHGSNEMTLRPYECIRKTAMSINAKYVFLDLNPNKGVLNRCLITRSSYLVIPTIPDFFSTETMNLIKEDLVVWQREMIKYGKSAEKPVKFIGYILNRYVPAGKVHGNGFVNGIYQDTLRKNEKIWADSVQAGADSLTELSDPEPPLPPLAVSRETYAKAERSNLLGKVREFHTLSDISDLFHVPVPFLGSEHLYKNSVNAEGEDVLKRMDADTIEAKLVDLQELRSIFENIHENILRIISQD